MATPVHDDIELRAGDDWEIDGKLLDEAGAVLDISGATLQWMLRDWNGAIVINGVHPDIAAIDATQGTVRIVVPATMTYGLQPGRYTDAFRVIMSGHPSVTWVGQILVAANPWEVPLL